jgi:hypothetical protein
MQANAAQRLNCCARELVLSQTCIELLPGGLEQFRLHSGSSFTRQRYGSSCMLSTYQAIAELPPTIDGRELFRL